MRIYVLDEGGPKDSENTLNSFLTKCGENVFWKIGPDMAFNKKSNLLECIFISKKSLEISLNLTS